MHPLKPRTLERSLVPKNEHVLELPQREDLFWFPTQRESNEHHSYMRGLGKMGARAIDKEKERELSRGRHCCMFCRLVRCSAGPDNVSVDTFEDAEKQALAETEAGRDTAEPVKQKIEKILTLLGGALPDDPLSIYGTRSLLFCAELRLEKRYPEKCEECNQTPCRFYTEVSDFLPMAWSMFRQGLHVYQIGYEAMNMFITEDSPKCMVWKNNEVFTYCES